MKPAWSVILLTTLIGAGQGLFLVGFAMHQLAGEEWFARAASAVAGMLLALGLVASFFHPGRPLRAWRAISQWRTSWLSREVIVLPAFMAAVALFAWEPRAWVGWLAVLLCLLLFYCTGMIYACLEFLREWHSPLTLANFVLLGLASGATLAATLSVFTARGYIGRLALAALWLGALAYVVRCASLARNAGLRPKFHGEPAPVLRAVRWAFLLLVFPLPALLLGWGGNSGAVLGAAFVLQFAGLLAERWYFFAEARHPQNLYYRSTA